MNNSKTRIFIDFFAAAAAASENESYKTEENQLNFF